MKTVLFTQVFIYNGWVVASNNQLGFLPCNKQGRCHQSCSRIKFPIKLRSEFKLTSDLNDYCLMLKITSVVVEQDKSLCSCCCCCDDENYQSVHLYLFVSALFWLPRDTDSTASRAHQVDCVTSRGGAGGQTNIRSNTTSQEDIYISRPTILPSSLKPDWRFPVRQIFSVISR